MRMGTGSSPPLFILMLLGAAVQELQVQGQRQGQEEVADPTTTPPLMTRKLSWLRHKHTGIE